MKKPILFSLLLMGMTATGFAQETNKDAPEFTGENFSLEGALAIFRKSSSIEEFEKLINEEGNNVNNLDLNNDDKIDYIAVDDIKDGNTHVLVLSTFINEKEKQDIATLGIEKTGDDSAVLQIEGDESLYAANTIVEPDESEVSGSKSAKGPSITDVDFAPIVVNVWLWPSVRFLYAPTYVVWASPYRWGFYPRWWKPWRPYRHTVFYTRNAPHRVYYHRTTTHRVVSARRVYTPRRHTSTLVVHNRRGTTVVHKNRNGKVKAVKVRGTRARARR